MRKVILLTAAATLSAAFDSAASNPSMIDPFTEPPAQEPEVAIPALKDPAPFNYDDGALIWHTEYGHAVVRLLVSEDGTASNVTIAVSNGHPRFDQAAINYAEEAQYVPGTVNGKRVSMPLIFNLVNCPPRRTDSCERQLAAIKPAIDKLARDYVAELEQIKQQAAAEQQRKTETRQLRYSKEQPYRVPPSLPLEPIDMAFRVFQTFEHFVYCGDSLFRRTSNGIAEYRGGKIRAERILRLDEIQILNGYEWAGEISFEYKMARESFGADREWSDWHRGDRVAVDVYKKKGKWFVDEENHFDDLDRDLACSDISK
jgi:TonB family protein